MLLDTPGFDNTEMEDVAILDELEKYVNKTWVIIYFGDSKP
jgi:hypothetical protein